jgi:hypothetical protein
LDFDGEMYSATCKAKKDVGGWDWNGL